MIQMTSLLISFRLLVFGKNAIFPWKKSANKRGLNDELYLCDSNIIIEGLKGNPVIADALQKIRTTNLAVSVVTVAELYYGAINKVELHQLQKHLSSLHQFPLTPDISYKFLQLMEAYALSHRPGLPDLLIAVTAIVHDVELYTLNVKDFRYIPGLQFYRP